MVEINLEKNYSIREAALVLNLTAQAVYNRLKLAPTNPYFIGSYLVEGRKMISGQELQRVYNQKMAVN
jgi:hypothetical protein